jgi:SAM-dependent methyltransferase
MGHDSSANKMKELLKKYVPPNPGRWVLEIGAYVVQDAYPEEDRYPPDAKVGGHRADIVPDRGIYTGLDLQAGTNVDIVAKAPYHWPVADGAYGLVLSAQCLEHVEDLKAFMAECYRCLAPGGLTIHIAPSAGQYHRCPVHCWYILDDGMRWLLNTAGFEVLEADLWDAFPWNDCWGVGRKPT